MSMENTENLDVKPEKNKSMYPWILAKWHLMKIRS